MEISTVQEVMEALQGARITGGERTDDGLHVYLDDGRLLLFTGEFLLYVGIPNKGTLQ
jgi:hypothetical protein